MNASPETCKIMVVKKRTDPWATGQTFRGVCGEPVPCPKHHGQPVRCDKCKEESVGLANCIECGSAYNRCAAHGGIEGAKRSLTSHKGLAHAKVRA